jgi:hypothetical protein
MRFVHNSRSDGFSALVSITFVTTNGRSWTLIFSRGSAMPPLAVVAAVAAAKVIQAGDTPASTVPIMVSAADWGAPVV